MPQCTAKSKRSGEQCKRMACHGSSKCAMHGGLTPKGAASPHFKTGKYSKLLPARLRERYHEALEDPKLLTMREELALTDARLADLLSRVDTGASGKLWSEARAAFKAFSAALESSDKENVSLTLRELSELLNRGHGDSMNWREISNLITQRQKIVESERKRILDAKQYVTLDQHMVLLSAVYEAVRTHVGDPKILRLIGTELAKILNRPVPIDKKADSEAS